MFGKSLIIRGKNQRVWGEKVGRVRWSEEGEQQSLWGGGVLGRPRSGGVVGRVDHELILLLLSTFSPFKKLLWLAVKKFCISVKLGIYFGIKSW